MNYYDEEHPTNQNHSKTGIGVLLGLLGLIGLLIGLLLYKENTEERRTFIKGWLWCFFVSLAVGIVIGIIVYFTAIKSFSDMINNISVFMMNIQ